MTTNYRALCAELLDWAEVTAAHYIQLPAVMLRARAALADEPAGREPVAVTGQPSDEALALIYHDCCRGCEFMDQGGFENAARAVLSRWGNHPGSPGSSPQPVAVSERLPGDQLCWWLEPDEEEDEAYGSSWTLLRICGGTSSYTHWLPAHALPLPEVGQ